MKYTREQKAEYFKKLRAEWKKSKELSEKDETAKAIFREAGLNVSYSSFYFTLQTMRDLGYDGIPYIDCKTFHGWIKAGFKVRKGEKSKIKGITWIEAKEKKTDDEEQYLFPKVYSLFHKSQVDEIEVDK